MRRRGTGYRPRPNPLRRQAEESRRLARLDRLPAPALAAAVRAAGRSRVVGGDVDGAWRAFGLVGLTPLGEFRAG